MGLLLICNGETTNLSYSGVHKVRYYLVEATIQYMKQHKKRIIYTIYEIYTGEYMDIDDKELETFEYEDTCTYEECEAQYEMVLEYLQKVSNTNQNRKVLFQVIPNMLDYELMAQNNAIHDNFMKPMGLYGVISFINRSDCDGHFTKGEATDFMDALNLIYPYIDKSQFDDYEENGRTLEGYYLYDIMNECITSKQCIRFS